LLKFIRNKTPYYKYYYYYYYIILNKLIDYSINRHIRHYQLVFHVNFLFPSEKVLFLTWKNQTRVILNLYLHTPHKLYIHTYVNIQKPTTTIIPSFIGDDPAEPYHFLFVQVSSVIMGVYLLVSTILGNVYPFSDAVSYALVAVMFLLLMAPLTVPLKMTLFPRNGIKSEQHVGSSSSAGALGSLNDQYNSPEVSELLALGEGTVKQKKRRPKRGEDFTFTEAIVEADFWLLILVYFVGVGTGVTVLNNLAQIGIARGEEDTATLLSIFSFCNFLGGLVEELYHNILSGEWHLLMYEKIVHIVFTCIIYSIFGSLKCKIHF